MGNDIMKSIIAKFGMSLGVFLGFVASALGQTEVLTVQGNLPRLNYRDPQGNLLWSLPANNVLWKLDGPFNAGVIVCTAAARSGSITLNDGGVSIRGGGFPSAKLHVGTITSQTEPGEVRIDPGNVNATATIHAVNADLSTLMILESQGDGDNASMRLKSKTATFSHTVANNFTIRDNNNAVNSFVIVPSDKNNNALVIRNGRIGLGTTNPLNPIELANGAKCTSGGVWTNASSRELKKDIEALPLNQAKEALSGLQPVTYRYNADPEEKQVGFIAEDVPELVATNTRKELSPMDVVAVLTKVVQDQQTQLDAQAEQIKQQAKMLEQTQAMLKQLSEQVK